MDVFAAYGWDPAMRDEEILEKLLARNLKMAAVTSSRERGDAKGEADQRRD